MKNSSKFLAFIPARSGSKRLPGKNIIKFLGKPLIAWTIEAALNSKHINEVVVSTDSQKISDISKDFGADVPFFRPSHLSGDRISVVDVLIDYLANLSVHPDYIVVLQPTSPLRTSFYIDDAIAKMGNNDSIISVTQMNKPDAWSNKLPNDGSLTNFLDPSLYNKQSQEYEAQFAFNGAIYICKTDRLVSEKNLILSSKTVAYKMPYEASIDIDNEIDLLVAKGIAIGLSKAIRKLDE